MIFVIRLVELAFELLILALIVRALLSWFAVDRRHPLIVFLDRLVDPLLDPIRRTIRSTGPVDISPLIAILLLYVLEQLVVRALLVLV